MDPAHPPRPALVGRLESLGPEHTARLGEALGALLEPGHVVGLVGELGCGKTCLTSGAARGAGVPPDVYVSSPTFTLVNEYPGRIPLVHADLYRLGDADELAELGLDEALGGAAACLVEWFDQFEEVRPPRHLEVRFEVTGEATRRLELLAAGAAHQTLARRWLRRAPAAAGAIIDRQAPPPRAKNR